MNITAITANTQCTGLVFATYTILEYLRPDAVHIWHPPSLHICLTRPYFPKQVRLFSFKVMKGLMDPAQVYNPLYWYTQHMTSTRVWDSIDTTHALVYQSDTVLCRPLDFMVFSKYSFIGGASHATDEQSIMYSHKMNGGFALHNVSHTRKCISQTSYIRFMEDSIWNNCRRQSVRTIDVMSFATDNGFTMCFGPESSRTCPYGAHKPWVQAHRQNLREFYKYCPNALKLCCKISPHRCKASCVNFGRTSTLTLNANN